MQKTNIVLITICSLLLVSFIIFYNKYQKVTKELSSFSLIMSQNTQYYSNILSQKEDSIQVLIGQVKNLNLKTQSIEGKYLTQAFYLKLLFDSLHASQYTTPIKDSTYIEVPFSGKQSIVKYSGFTRYFFDTDKSMYQISFVFDPIFVKSELYRDKDNMWKIFTKSLTPGVKINVDYSIDSAFYVQNQLSEVLVKEPILKLRAYVQTLSSFNNYNSQFSLGMEGYYRNFYLGYDFVQRNVYAGIYYDFNILYQYKKER
uniref:Uncharacterized protein n=1 Tax=Dictyoglomus turgidum TaxID=513050 RepID=A0A7C3SML5_9BACT